MRPTKTGKARQEGAVVYAGVRELDPGIEEVNESPLKREGKIISQEVVQPAAALQVELKGSAQVRLADVRCGGTGAQK